MQIPFIGYKVQNVTKKSFVMGKVAKRTLRFNQTVTVTVLR